MSLQTDALALAQEGIGAVNAAIDTAFKDVDTAVPQLTGDAATFAEEYVEQHVGGAAGDWLKGVLGLAGGAIASEASTLTAPVLAGLQIAQARVDADLKAVSAKL